jgi:uncharacterized protein (DUF1786 family)
MSGRSREKGARWQGDLARRWRASGLYPDAYSTQGGQVRRVRPSASDVDGTPWVVEAKHCKLVNIRAALEQAEAAAAADKDNRPVVAVTRYHGTGPDEAVVSMRLTVFEELILALREGFEAP